MTGKTPGVPATLGGLPVDTAPAARRACSLDRWPRAAKLVQARREPALVDGVVRPGSAEQVAAVLADATRRGLAVLPVGLRSGVTGGLTATPGQVAVDLAGLDRIDEVNPCSLTVRAGAGVRGSALEAALAARGLTLGHDPQSLHLSSVGGWVATRASGIASTRYGSIERRLAAVQVALADGTLVTTPAWPRASVGPDLAQLFVGAEGALGVVCSATLRALRAPQARVFRAVALPSFDAGLELLRRCLQDGLAPAVARLYNADEATRFTGQVPALLLLVHEGLGELVEVESRLVAGYCAQAGGRPLDDRVALGWWRGRYDATHLFRYADRPGGVADAIEVAADWAGVARLAHRLDQALRPLATTLYLHASHLYEDGASLYAIVFLDAEGPLEVVERYDRAWQAAMDACLAEGAAISHHHGVGAVRLGALDAALGSQAELLRRVKAALDPAGTLSPGRLGLAPR